MRILVTIANHGEGRPAMVADLIAEYHSMPHEVDVVLLSDRDKPAVTGAEVLVGAPTENPYSLPFSHRQLFKDRRSDYDLFIYSEDDTLMTEKVLDRWLEINRLLPDRFVPGFIRFEIDESGFRSYPSFHSAFHWQTETISEFGGELVASYSNLHSALYVIDRPALEVALASGNFDVPPHSGRFDMLVMAGAGPFMNCGLERVLPLRRTRELALHHLPNDYVGTLGISDEGLQRQLDACVDVHYRRRIAGQLFPIATRLDEFTYDKMVYEQILEAIPAAVPATATKVLSVGAGMGLLERRLSERHQVTCVPLDAIAQAELEHGGLETTPPDLDMALAELSGTKFDALVLSNVLHHVPDPECWLKRLIPLVQGGVVIASVPERRSYQIRALAQSVTGSTGLRGHKMSKLHAPPRTAYSVTKLHRSGRRWLKKRMSAAGIGRLTTVHEQEPPRIISDRYRVSRVGRLLPSHVVVDGRVG